MNVIVNRPASGSIIHYSWTEDSYISRFRSIFALKIALVNVALLLASDRSYSLPVASEPRGQPTPHFLEHGVQRGQGHRILDNWIGGSYSIVAEIALENIIFGRHCRNIG